jgi:pSer/pThr/pTyr-binding forkhead associated (FHA) protein
MKASGRHAIFRRIGPETWIESQGSNGTYRWTGSGWARLPDRKRLLVQSGDRLRLGDVDVDLA